LRAGASFGIQTLEAGGIASVSGFASLATAGFAIGQLLSALQAELV
jgi:hypothetical protein